MWIFYQWPIFESVPFFASDFKNFFSAKCRLCNFYSFWLQKVEVSIKKIITDGLSKAWYLFSWGSFEIKIGPLEINNAILLLESKSDYCSHFNYGLKRKLSKEYCKTHMLLEEGKILKIKQVVLVKRKRVGLFLNLLLFTRKYTSANLKSLQHPSQWNFWQSNSSVYLNLALSRTLI